MLSQGCQKCRSLLHVSSVILQSSTVCSGSFFMTGWNPCTLVWRSGGGFYHTVIHALSVNATWSSSSKRPCQPDHLYSSHSSYTGFEMNCIVACCLPVALLFKEPPGDLFSTVAFELSEAFYFVFFFFLQGSKISTWLISPPFQTFHLLCN